MNRAGLGGGEQPPRRIFAELEQISLVDVVPPARTGIERDLRTPPTIKQSCSSASASNSRRTSNLQARSEDFALFAM
jgi:hypothetical protein